MQNLPSEFNQNYSPRDETDDVYITDTTAGVRIIANEYQGSSASIGHYTQLDAPVQKIVYENEPVPIPVDARYGSEPDYITSKVKHLREVFKERPEVAAPIHKTGKVWTPIDSRWEPIHKEFHQLQVCWRSCI